MMRVTVELIRAADGQRSLLGVMDIYNDGESRDPRRGNYVARLYRKGGLTVQRQTTVKNWPRQAYTVWRLVQRVLNQLDAR